MALKNLYQYVGGNAEIQRARAFWKWYEMHQSAYLFLNEVDLREKERLINKLLKALHQYNPNLYFELGGHNSLDRHEFIITAEGIEKHFAAVELLTEMAPSLANWKIIAFKPAVGTDFKLELGGREFDPKEVCFMPLVSENQPQAIGIQVCYPDYEENNKPFFLQGTYLLLNGLLGEKAAAQHVDFLKISSTPDDLDAYETLPLSELPSYIQSKKIKAT